MTRQLSLVALLLLILLVGCDLSRRLDQMAPQDVASAKIYFDLLRHHQYEQIESVLDPSLKDLNIRNSLITMAAYIPDENPISEKTVQVNVLCRTGGGCEKTIGLEYEFPSQWVLARVVIRSEGDKSSVTGFHVQAMSQSLENANRFTLSGKSIPQFVILALAILLPIFTIYFAIVCIRTKHLRRKWLWVIFILTGVGRIAVLWTTGQFAFNLFYVQLFSASMVAQAFGPWVVSVSLPWGAMIFWIFRPSPGQPDEQTMDLRAEDRDRNSADSLLHLTGEQVMSDGREEREEREKRREQEERESREDRLDRYPVDQWEKERDDS